MKTASATPLCHQTLYLYYWWLGSKLAPFSYSVFNSVFACAPYLILRSLLLAAAGTFIVWQHRVR
jgi:hypothetical protein